MEEKIERLEERIKKLERKEKRRQTFAAIKIIIVILVVGIVVTYGIHLYKEFEKTIAPYKEITEKIEGNDLGNLIKDYVSK